MDARRKEAMNTKNATTSGYGSQREEQIMENAKSDAAKEKKEAEKKKNQKITKEMLMDIDMNTAQLTGELFDSAMYLRTLRDRFKQDKGTYSKCKVDETFLKEVLQKLTGMEEERKQLAMRVKRMSERTEIVNGQVERNLLIGEHFRSIKSALQKEEQQHEQALKRDQSLLQEIREKVAALTSEEPDGNKGKGEAKKGNSTMEDAAKLVDDEWSAVLGTMKELCDALKSCEHKGANMQLVFTLQQLIRSVYQYCDDEEREQA